MSETLGNCDPGAIVRVLADGWIGHPYQAPTRHRSPDTRVEVLADSLAALVSERDKLTEAIESLGIDANDPEVNLRALEYAGSHEYLESELRERAEQAEAERDAARNTIQAIHMALTEVRCDTSTGANWRRLIDNIIRDREKLLGSLADVRAERDAARAQVAAMHEALDRLLTLADRKCWDDPEYAAYDHACTVRDDTATAAAAIIQRAREDGSAATAHWAGPEFVAEITARAKAEAVEEHRPALMLASYVLDELVEHWCCDLDSWDMIQCATSLGLFEVRKVPIAEEAESLGLEDWTPDGDFHLLTEAGRRWRKLIDAKSPAPSAPAGEATKGEDDHA